MRVYALQMIIRNKKRTFALMVTVIAISFFIHSYFQTVTKLQNNLEEAYQKVKVTAKIKPRSYEETVRIPFDIIENILDTGFVKKAKMSIRDYACFLYMVGKITTDNLDIYPELIGTYDIQSESWYSGLKSNYMDGYDDTSFMGDENICILDQNSLEYQKISLGDVIQLQAYFNGKEYKSIDEMGGASFKVCGYFENNDANEIAGNDVIVPIRSFMNQMDVLYDNALDDVQLKEKKVVSSVSFELQNTKELRTFKAFLKTTDLGKDVELRKDINLKNLEFELDDKELIELTVPMKRTIHTLLTFRPAVLLLAISIAVFIAYLFVMTVKVDMVLMYLIGRKKTSIYFSIGIQLLIPATIAMVIVELVLVLFASTKIAVWYDLAFYICFICSVLGWIGVKLSRLGRAESLSTIKYI